MVQRTQTAHLPDAFDPTPVAQNIDVYYTDLKYAGISFAIIEDRKFKSAPKPLLPEAKIYNGWAQNKTYDELAHSDVEGAVLLGQRQLDFLENWSVDWPDNTWMKVVLSQTIFANVATLPEPESNSDAIMPTLRIIKKGEYPPNDIPVADFDANLAGSTVHSAFRSTRVKSAVPPFLISPTGGLSIPAGLFVIL